MVLNKFIDTKVLKGNFSDLITMIEIIKSIFFDYYRPQTLILFS